MENSREMEDQLSDELSGELREEVFRALNQLFFNKTTPKLFSVYLADLGFSGSDKNFIYETGDLFFSYCVINVLLEFGAHMNISQKLHEKLGDCLKNGVFSITRSEWFARLLEDFVLENGINRDEFLRKAINLIGAET